MTTSESEGRFFTKRIDSHNESNRIDSNRELECSIARSVVLITMHLGALVMQDLRPTISCSWSRHAGRQDIAAPITCRQSNTWVLSPAEDMSQLKQLHHIMRADDDADEYAGWPRNCTFFICLMLNWPNFITFGWEEDILNTVCKLISTILCDWHCLVVCQHNSWANFILRQRRKRTILFLQGSVGTRNRCCGQYMLCFVGNLFRCKSAKNYKIRLRFHKAISI